MEITKEMLIAEFKRQIDFAKFVESQHTSPFRTEFLHFAIQYILDLEDENKRLRKSYRIAVQDNADTCQLLFKAEDEIKRLKSRCVAKIVFDEDKLHELVDGAIERFELDSKQIVYDIVTEMVEKLKNAQERQDGIAFDLVSFETIDRIAQEMIGETK